MNARLLSLFALIAFVNAQASDSTGTASATASGAPATPSLPTCVQDCITTQAQTAGCDPTTPACVCGSDFVNGLIPCVSACSPDDQAAALAAQSAICGAASTGAPSASASAAPTTTPSASSSTRPVSGSSSTRPATSGAATPPASATSAGASTSATNAAVPMAAQGVWAMAAGLLGFAAAL